jgi:hypothetical protein
VLTNTLKMPMSTAIRELPILFSAPMVRADLEDRKTATRRVVKPQPVLNLDSGDIARIGRPDTQSLGYFSGNTPYRWSKRDQAPERTPCPYGEPGDRLWVKETFFAWGRWETRFSAKKGRDEWHFVDMTVASGKDYLYAADGVSDTLAFVKRRSETLPMYWKRPAIFMPRHASRITLELTGVRGERVQDITSEQILAEGVEIPVDAATGNPLIDVSTKHGPAHFLPKLSSHTMNDLLHAHWAALWVQINGMESWNANPLVWVIEFKRVTA